MKGTTQQLAKTTKLSMSTNPKLAPFPGKFKYSAPNSNTNLRTQRKQEKNCKN